MKLLIHHDGQQFGPYSLKQARALVAQGNFSRGDLAWPDGATKWVPLGDALKYGDKPARWWGSRVTATRICLGMFLAVVAMWGCWRIHLSLEIKRRLAAIKAAGYPTTAAELNTWYPAVPDSENAALLFLQASNALFHYNMAGDTASTEALRLLPRTGPLPEEVRSVFTADLETCKGVLPCLHEAASRKRSRYPDDFAGMSHIFLIHRAGRLLNKEALLAAEGLRPGVTTGDSILAHLGIARTLKAEPRLNSQFMRMAADLTAISTLERALNRTNFAEVQLASLAVALEEADDPAAWMRAVAGKRADDAALFRMSGAEMARVSKGRGLGLPSGRISNVLRFTGLLDRDLLFYLDAMETNMNALSLPAPQSLGASSRVLEGRRGLHLMSAGLLFNCESLPTKVADHSARLRVARTSVAIERFRLAHSNACPESLAALVPAYLTAVPTDPWDGRALRWKRLEKGYVVYSIGSDGKDDGGAEPSTGNTGRANRSDITFAVER